MRLLIALMISLLFIPAPARALVARVKDGGAIGTGKDVAYKDGDAELEGFWVDAKGAKEKAAPTVLIVHQWMGLTDYEKDRARQLSALGYNAFAVDIYGKGVRPASKEEAGKQKDIYANDPTLTRRRITAALNFARAQKGVDAQRVVVIGYCFGGLVALEAARSGADVRGVASFHGDLGTKAPAEPGAIKTKIAVYHGADDPYVKQEAVQKFIEEMKTANADWTLTQYAHAVHAFTMKSAGSDPSAGAAYNAEADRQSWAAFLVFLKDVTG